MERVLLIGALAVFTIVQLAATGGAEVKMPKGMNLYDYHMEGDSTKNDSLNRSELPPRDTTAIITSDSIGIRAERLPNDFRLYSRAMPRYNYAKLVVGDTLTKKKKKQLARKSNKVSDKESTKNK